MMKIIHNGSYFKQENCERPKSISDFVIFMLFVSGIAWSFAIILMKSLYFDEPFLA